VQVFPLKQLLGARSSVLQPAQSAAGVLTEALSTSIDSAPYLNRSTEVSRQAAEARHAASW